MAAVTTAVLGSVGLWATDGWAQEEPSQGEEQLLQLPLEKLLDMKISTPSLRPQAVRDVPVTTYVVTEEDFRVYGFRDLKDILRNLPGIEYTYPFSHLFGGQRGFSSFWEQSKLLINGREVNLLSSDAAYITNQFSLNGIKRVEIVQAPASVLYGPEAFTGVINMITKDADNGPVGSELTGIVGGGDKSSLDTNVAFHTVFRRGPLDVAMGAYLDGNKEPNQTDFVKSTDYTVANRDLRVFLLERGNSYRDVGRNYRFNVDLAYALSDQLRVRAGMLYWRSEDGAGFENPALSFTNDEFIAEQTHFYASGEYRFETIPVKATLSYHLGVENAYAHFQSFLDTGDNPPFIASYTFQNDKLNVVNLQVDYFPSLIDNYFLAGIGMRDTRIGEPTFTGLAATDVTPGQPVSLVGRYLYPPRGYFSNLRPFLGQNRIYLYAQDQQSLWDKRIEITAGLRFDHHSIYGNILNVRSGLLVRPLRNYAIRGAFGQGFREPTIFELSDNPNLSPARMNTWEVSLLFTPLANLSGQIAYFQNRASKLIVLSRGTTSRGGIPENVGEKSVGGVETLLKYQVGRLGGDVWYSYEYPIDDQPLRGTARNKLGFGPHYAFGKHLSLAVRGKWTSRAHGQALDAAGSTVDISVPQYFTMDLNLFAHSLSFAGCKADVSFQILNILGRTNYYVDTVGPNPARYLAEGREFFGKATLSF